MRSHVPRQQVDAENAAVAAENAENAFGFDMNAVRLHHELRCHRRVRRIGRVRRAQLLLELGRYIERYNRAV